MNFNVFYFLLLSVIGGTLSATIPVIGGQLPGIGNGIGGTAGGLGGLLGGGETRNVLGSLPGVNSAAKAVNGLREQIGNAAAQKLFQNPLEKSGVKIPNLLPGIGNGLGGTGNVLGSLPDVNSVMKTVGGLGQGIENAVGKKLIEAAAEQGLKNIHQYETRVLKTMEDFFGGLFNTGEKGGEKGLFPKTAENSLKAIQGAGSGLLSQVENAIGQIGGGGVVPKIGG